MKINNEAIKIGDELTRLNNVDLVRLETENLRSLIRIYGMSGNKFDIHLPLGLLDRFSVLNQFSQVSYPKDSPKKIRAFFMQLVGLRDRYADDNPALSAAFKDMITLLTEEVLLPNEAFRYLLDEDTRTAIGHRLLLKSPKAKSPVVGLVNAAIVLAVGLVTANVFKHNSEELSPLDFGEDVEAIALAHAHLSAQNVGAELNAQVRANLIAAGIEIKTEEVATVLAAIQPEPEPEPAPEPRHRTRRIEPRNEPIVPEPRPTVVPDLTETTPQRISVLPSRNFTAEELVGRSLVLRNDREVPFYNADGDLLGTYRNARQPREFDQVLASTFMIDGEPIDCIGVELSNVAGTSSSIVYIPRNFVGVLPEDL